MRAHVLLNSLNELKKIDKMPGLSSIQSLFFATNNSIITPGCQLSKTSILLRYVDQKSLETEFSITICRLTGDKWQSKTLFLSIFNPRSSIVKSVFYCRLPGVIIQEHKY